MQRHTCINIERSTLVIGLDEDEDKALVEDRYSTHSRENMGQTEHTEP